MGFNVSMIENFEACGAGVPGSLVDAAALEDFEAWEYARKAIAENTPPEDVEPSDVDVKFAAKQVGEYAVGGYIIDLMRQAILDAIREQGFRWDPASRKWVEVEE